MWMCRIARKRVPRDSVREKHREVHGTCHNTEDIEVSA